MKYRVDRYYSTYRSFEVDAETEEEAGDKVEQIALSDHSNWDEIEANLERWEEADIVEECE
jgi:hypothetical protein